MHTAHPQTVLGLLYLLSLELGILLQLVVLLRYHLLYQALEKEILPRHLLQGGLQDLYFLNLPKALHSLLYGDLVRVDIKMVNDETTILALDLYWCLIQVGILLQLL